MSNYPDNPDFEERLNRALEDQKIHDETEDPEVKDPEELEKLEKEYRENKDRKKRSSRLTGKAG